ncbi:MAG: hypothetical protein WBG86_14565 [Polyangiales bacterium]
MNFILEEDVRFQSFILTAVALERVPIVAISPGDNELMTASCGAFRWRMAVTYETITQRRSTDPIEIAHVFHDLMEREIREPGMVEIVRRAWRDRWPTLVPHRLPPWRPDYCRSFRDFTRDRFQQSFIDDVRRDSPGYSPASSYQQRPRPRTFDDVAVEAVVDEMRPDHEAIRLRASIQDHIERHGEAVARSLIGGHQTRDRTAGGEKIDRPRSLAQPNTKLPSYRPV